MPTRPTPLWPLLFPALLSAGLLLLCFPPFDLGWVAWIALVPLLWAWGRAARPLHGALLGLLFGVAFFAGLNRYLLMFGVVPTFALGLLEALPLLVVGGAAVRWLSGADPFGWALGLAALWVPAEWLRGHVGALSLTYGQLGYTQYANLPLLQCASLGGVLLLSFLLVTVNAALAQTVGARRGAACAGACGGWALLLAVGLLLAGCHLGGFLVLHRASPADPQLTVGVVQGAVDAETPVSADDVDECLRVYPGLTEGLLRAHDAYGDLASAPRPEFLLWPETAFPLFLNRDSSARLLAERTALDNRVWLLMGALELSDFGAVFNNAWLFDDQGLPRGTYSKQSLVMFGEYVPFRERFPFLSRYPIRPFDFSPGGERNLLEVKGAPVGALICFEAIFPGPSRELVLQGAQLLTFMSSDAWADRSLEVLLHSHTAPFRAVETRRWVLRAATDGVSGIISPRGEWVERVPAFQPGAVSATVGLSSRLSWYTRWGDGPLLALCFLLLLGAARTSRRRPDSVALEPFRFGGYPGGWPGR